MHDNTDVWLSTSFILLHTSYDYLWLKVQGRENTYYTFELILSLTFFPNVLIVFTICSKQRLFSGLLTAVTSGFLTFTFLEPLFEPVGLELAEVALYLLAIYGFLVGMSLGIMLPTLFPGLCFGASLGLFIASFGLSTSEVFFPILGGILAVICAAASVRYVVW